MTVPEPLITATPDRLGGEPVFAGTRVPVRALFEYLEAGDPLGEFLKHFPSVPRAHAIAVLKESGAAVVVRAAIKQRYGVFPEELPTLGEPLARIERRENPSEERHQSLSKIFRELAAKFPPLSTGEIRGLREQADREAGR